MKKASLMMIILWSVIGLVLLAFLIVGMVFDRGGDRLFGAGSSNASLVVDESVSAKELDTVRIDLSADMCRVFLTDGDNVNIKHYARGISNDRYARTSQQNGTLTVSTKSDFSFKMFNFAWNSYSLIEVYLPRSYKEKLDVNISSGTLTIEDGLDLNGLGIKISSGTIRSEYAIKAPSANIGVTSGTVRLTGGLEADEYGVKVSSGTVDVDGLKGSGSVEATSGTIRLSGVDIKEHLNVKVSSGTINIGIEGNPPLEFTGRKTSGTIRTYFAIFDGGSGNFSATTGEAPYKKLDARVTSGTIRITQD